MGQNFFKQFIKILLLFAIGLPGCKTVSREFIFNTSGIPLTAPINNNAAHPIYYNYIKPEDELSIRILNGQGATLPPGTEKNTFRVDADGNINLPMTGKVKVEGLDRWQASERIAQAYAKMELKAPIVEVLISNMRVTILGEVTQQGSYPILREDYELTDLLGDARGFSANANTEALKIFRGNRRAPVVIPINMNHYRFLADPALILHSGDIIYVPPKTAAIKLKNAQQYSGFIQLGLVLISTLFIIINR